MPDYHINVVVDPARAKRGVQDTNRALRTVEGKADRVRRALGAAFAFAGAYVGIRQLVQLSDTFTSLENRARIVTTSQGQLNAVFAELFQTANETRSSFEGTVELYNRVALAGKDLSLTQREVLDFTRSLNQAIILSGASGAEAQAGLIQLSQGLASGALRGDELRSVLEQLPKVADVIAQELGITRGELRVLGAEGKITSDIIIRAFKNASSDLESDFGTTLPTISQAFQVLRNQALFFVGDANKASGAAQGLAIAILKIAQAIPTASEKIASFSIQAGVLFRGTLDALRADTEEEAVKIVQARNATLRALQAEAKRREDEQKGVSDLLNELIGGGGLATPVPEPVPVVPVDTGALLEPAASAIEMAREHREELERLAGFLDEFQSPQQRFEQQLGVLNDAWIAQRRGVADFGLTLEEYERILESIRPKQDEQVMQATRLGQAIASIDAQIGSVGRATETFALGGVEALASSFETAIGRGNNFVDFLGDLSNALADVTRQIASLALRSLLLEGLAGIGLKTAEPRQHGGAVQPGRPYLVGERGPELVTPSSAGRVTPNSQMGGTNIKVVNISDPNEIGREIDSGDNDERILNFLTRNPRSARAALGLS